MIAPAPALAAGRAEGSAAAVAQAFDRVARAYDAEFGVNPAGLVFRHVVQRRLLALAPQGARVLDVGCGTGDDALMLAEQGRRVVAIDVSEEMVRRCREKAEARGVGEDRLRVERRAAEDLAALEGPFDAAYSNFGALNCADLPAAGRGLGRLLRHGAPVLVSLMRPHPLLERLFGARGGSAPRVGGQPVPVHHPSPREARAALGEAFAWRGGFALGVLVPAPNHPAWPARHPLAFAALAAAEGLVRHWALVRALGDHVVLEGRRR